jgi:outer membrane protein TolC
LDRDSTVIVSPWLTQGLTRLPLMLLLIVSAAGCSRKFFRERADDEVKTLLNAKSDKTDWPLEQWHVYPDGRARFVDVDNPDHPKKPPDDPAAAALAPNPQPLRSHFCQGPDREGRGYIEFIESCDLMNRAANGDAEAAKQVARAKYDRSVATAKTAAVSSIDRALQTLERPYVMTLEQASELALFNSRDFQDRREDLYLSALPVTQERFAFVAQFAGTEQAIREWTGTRDAAGPGSRWRMNSDGSGSLLLPTGATLLAQLANRLVIDLSTKRPTVGLSNLTLSLTQPLLRGGGWAATLEPLTQAERNLVYGVRSFARFRKNYYVYLAGGADVFNSPYAYVGLNLRGVGPNLTAPSQGYLPTILSAAQEQIERENIAILSYYLELFRELQAKGEFSDLQVGQVEQQLLRGQSTILQRRQELQNGLDQFKLQLGVPTNMPLKLDDSPTKPIEGILERFTQARDEFLEVREEATRFLSGKRIPLASLAGAITYAVPLEVPLREKLSDLMFNSPLVKGTKQFSAAIGARWQRWKDANSDTVQDTVRLYRDQIRELQLKQTRLEVLGEKLPPDEAARLAQLQREAILGQFELTLRQYEAAREKKSTARDVSIRYEETINTFILVLGEARKERQAGVRASWPKLPKVNVDGNDLLQDDLDKANTVAAQVALSQRFDLMNARGQLNDSWRQIAVQANSLLGVVDVGYNFTSPSTPNANEPFALGGSKSRHQLILNMELPLVRRAERNEYRVSLIAYQRNRRNVQAVEDFILNDVRTGLRQLRVLAENYKIQQRNVEVAYDQVENALDVLQSPPIPQQGNSAGNAAALTQQLLQAQTGLLGAQNQLYTVWVNYLIARMTFYRDLERLPLDARGVWLDDESLSEPGPEILPGPGPAGIGGADGERPPPRFAELR